MYLIYFVFYLFSESIFFILMGFGKSNGILNDNLYADFRILLTILALLLILFRTSKLVFMKKLAITYKVLLLISVSFIPILSILISYFFINNSEFTIRILMFYVTMCIPSIYLAILINQKDINNFFKVLKVFTIVLTFCFIFQMITNETNGLSVINKIGGANHLTIGYTTSLLTSVSLLSLFNSDKLHTKILWISMLISDISILFISGARGALVATTIIIILLSYNFIVNEKRIVFFSIFFMPFLIGGLYILIKVFLKKELFWRLLYTFDDKNSDVTGGRVLLYDKAVEMIMEKPIFGNGVGTFSSTLNMYVFPHNIFLQLLNEFGFFVFIICIIILYLLLKKAFILLKISNNNLMIISIFFIIIFVSLNFSGNYLTNFQFWMLLSLLYKYKINIKGVHDGASDN